MQTNKQTDFANHGDTISRRAVFDAIATSLKLFGDRYTNEQLNMWGLFMQMIQELPSAQPEIIRCGECTHKDKKIDYCHYLGITICERDYCCYAERRTDEGDRC